MYRILIKKYNDGRAEYIPQKRLPISTYLKALCFPVFGQAFFLGSLIHMWDDIDEDFNCENPFNFKMAKFDTLEGAKSFIDIVILYNKNEKQKEKQKKFNSKFKTTKLKYP